MMVAFKPVEVTIPHITYACLGGFVVLFGMFSLFLREKLYIGEACWAFLFGVIIGPYGANIFNPHSWGNGNDDVTNIITLEFTRVVLAIGVFAIGVELPKAYMAKHWKSIFFLLVPVMTWGWFVSAGLIFALIPGLNFLSSLAVAACLTPTDPILAAAVVGGKWADKHVPAHIRHLLAAESGCNDGAAFPFLFISLYLLLDAPRTGLAIRDWFLLLWLYQVILGIVIGALLGFGFRYLMKFCQSHNLIDRQSYVAQYISLAMLTIGVNTLIGSDDLLAAFACGTAFAWDGFFNRQTEESVFSSVIDLLFNVAAFVYVGAWMPFSSFSNAELTLSVWRLIVIAILVLLLRRLPVVVALYRWIPDIKTFREAIFAGHFGPIGIGAVFISTLANEVIHKDKHPHNQQIVLLSESIQPIVAFMVLCSITIHGLSITSFSLGRRVHTVSRTWSRHAAPEWTTQARMVERGAADIVINRDSAMERGEVPPDVKAPESRTLTSREPSIIITEKDRTSWEAEKEGGLPEGAPESPPDGTETDMEWREGRHRVVEHKAEPGAEVNVDVQRNAYPSDQSLPSQIRKSLEGLKRTAEHLPDRGHQLRDKVVDVEHKVQKALSETTARAAGPSRQRDGESFRQHGDEDDEGWASEQSHSDKASSAGTSKKRSKTKTMRSQPLGAGRRGRQRTSIRRAHPPPAIRLQEKTPSPDSSGGSGAATPPSHTPPEETEPRGRSPVPTGAHFTEDYAWRQRSPPSPRSRPGTGGRPRTAESSLLRPGTADSSILNHRVSHIRAMHSSPPTRDVSPARSIRFLDEPIRQEGDDPESRNRVTFDAPRSASGSGRP
ncbi:putative sodium/hydrogen exchanger family protein [Lyophyllum shimeji]|uniref:Sodium/hydrogen exchanger family protein n=1 Tax=Lyophyllum shimeji TaxID=47721 RepID=A0A9P3UPA4_LYOSH|nr:putative sodium/hydrogen exchanger family protein [Lyophyllum shimeji]